MTFYKDVVNFFKVTFDYLFIDSLNVKKNIIVDSVVLRMNYLNEDEQKYILKMVEDFTDYIENKDKE